MESLYKRLWPASDHDRGVRVALVFGAVSFFIYCLTLSPTVNPGDSGDFLTAICTFSLSHPPGFPLYLLLGKGFSLLPIPIGFAAKVNLFSAFCDSVAAILVLLTTLEYCGSVGAALFAGCLFAFSPVVWQYAISAEVFALNNLFVALLWYLLILSINSRKTKYVYGIALAFGFGLSNHPILIFVGIPVLLTALWLERNTFCRGYKLLTVAGLIAMGLSPYVTLLWRTGAGAVIPWGNLEIVSGFLNYVLRRQYGTFSLYPNLAAISLLDQLSFFSKEVIFRQLLPPGFLLALLGLAVGLRKKRHPKQVFLWVSLASAVVYFYVFYIYSLVPEVSEVTKTIQLRFLQTLVISMAIWAGAGAWAFFGWRSWSQKWISGGLAVCVGIQVVIGIQVERGKDRSLIYTYAQKYLKGLPVRSLLLLGGDTEVNSVNYLQSCEGQRKDVFVFPRDILVDDWRVEMLKRAHPEVVLEVPFVISRFLDSNSGKFNLFVSDYYPQQDQDWENRYSVLPFGLISWVIRSGLPVPDLEQYLSVSRGLMDDANYLQYARVPAESWEGHLFRRSADSYSRFALSLYHHALKTPDRQEKLLTLAAEYYDRFMAVNPSPIPRAFKNWGMIHFHRMKFDRDGRDRLIAVGAWRKFVAVAPFDDPDLLEIRGFLGL